MTPANTKYSVAYTRDGGHPVGGSEITSWLQTNGADATFAAMDEALIACENDGWRGYTVVYPTGASISIQGALS